MTSRLERVELVIPLHPITKKNSQQIIYNPKLKRSMIIPGKKYKEYEKAAGQHLRAMDMCIDYPGLRS